MQSTRVLQSAFACFILLLLSLPAVAGSNEASDKTPLTRLQAAIDGPPDITGLAGSTLDAATRQLAALSDPHIYPRYSKEEPVNSFPMHAAALNDDAALAARLIELGTPVDTPDRDGRTPLMVAAAFGNVAVAEVFLAQGADPRARDRVYGDTPIHFAALAGRIEIARLLLERGADINIGANLGETPLHYAALYNHRKMIEFLVEEGADIDATDGMRLRPLQYASRRGRVQSVNLLRELGARPDTLLDAVNAGDLIRVRELLRGGADANQPGLDGTALHLAAALGHVAIAATLIDAGADLEAEGEPARAHPLHVAAQNNRAEMALLLIGRGAMVDAHDAEGRTPLMVAAEFGGDGRLGEVFLTQGADPAAVDRTWGDTVLHYAACSNNAAIAELLLSRGVDVNARNKRSGTAPLHYAVGNGKVEMIKWLAARGADLSPVDLVGTTPYARAIANANLPAMALLVELGAPQ